MNRVCCRNEGDANTGVVIYLRLPRDVLVRNWYWGFWCRSTRMVRRRDLPSSLCSRNEPPVRMDEKSQGETELQLGGVQRDVVRF